MISELTVATDAGGFIGGRFVADLLDRGAAHIRVVDGKPLTRAEAAVKEAEERAAQVRKRALEEVSRSEREVQETETALVRSRSRLTVLRREAE